MKRQIAGDRRRLHAGQRMHAAENFVKERDAVFVIGIFQFGQIDLRREQMIRPETGIEVPQVKEAVDQRPAPMSKTKETATSAITSKLRSRLPLLPPAASRPPSFSVSLRLKFDACVAGARPKIRAGDNRHEQR